MKNQIEYRKTCIFWGSTYLLSYLLTFALWIYSMDVDDVSDFIVAAIVSVFAAAITFWFVGLGLVYLFISGIVLLDLFDHITGRRS